MLAGSGSSITGAASTVVRDNTNTKFVLLSNNNGKYRHPMNHFIVYNQ